MRIRINGTVVSDGAGYIKPFKYIYDAENNWLEWGPMAVKWDDEKITVLKWRWTLRRWDGEYYEFSRHSRKRNFTHLYATARHYIRIRYRKEGVIEMEY